MYANNWIAAVLSGLILFALFLGTSQSLVTAQNSPDDGQTFDRFQVYAQKLFRDYDKNRDGYLSAKEVQDMELPLSDKRFDLDSDGKISLKETVEAIRRPSARKAKEKQIVDSSQDKGLSRYFAALVKKYDADGDGLLNADEMKRMRRPPEKGVDINSDGNISIAELMQSNSISSSNAKSKETDKQQTITIAKKDAADRTRLAQIHLKFLEEALNKNDTNRNGQLDPEEIAKTKWSSPPWQDSDPNGDGILSRSELKARYSNMVDNMFIEKSDQRRNLERASQAKQRKAGRLIGGGLSGDMLSGDMRGGAGSGDMLSNILEGAQRNSRAMAGNRGAVSSPNSRNPRVEVDIYLLRIPKRNDTVKMIAALDSVRSSSANKVGDTISKLAESMGVGNFDRIFFTAINGNETTIMTGSQIPVKTGSMQGRGGVRTDSFENRDVGLHAEIRPTIEQDYVTLQVSLSKSDVINGEETGEGVSQPKTITWEYSSTIRIDEGQPAVIASSSNDQTWILVAKATVIDRDQPESKRNSR